VTSPIRAPGATDRVGELLVECVDAARTLGTGAATVVAVHGADCQVHRGDRIALTGRSGSGKSTLLHLLAGLDVPTAGLVTWPAWHGSPVGRPGTVGVVFQGPSLLPALDVRENVALPLLLAGMPDPGAAQRATEALDALGIGGLAAALPSELSGGQAQRVAVARVLAAEPSLILADEPTGQLDHASADQVVTVLLQAATELDAALLVATHDEAVAKRLDRRWRIVDGRLSTDVRAGTASDRGRAS
jgi:putative ABC transport system ATP-binding protein